MTWKCFEHRQNLSPMQNANCNAWAVRPECDEDRPWGRICKQVAATLRREGPCAGSVEGTLQVTGKVTAG